MDLGLVLGPDSLSFLLEIPCIFPCLILSVSFLLMSLNIEFIEDKTSLLFDFDIFSQNNNKDACVRDQTPPLAIRDPMRPEDGFIPTTVPFSDVPSILPSGFPIASSLSILLLLIESRFLVSRTHVLPFSLGLSLGDEHGVTGAFPPLTVIIEALRIFSSSLLFSFSSFSAQSFKNFDIFLSVEISSPRASSIPSIRYSA